MKVEAKTQVLPAGAQKPQTFKSALESNAPVRPVKKAVLAVASSPSAVRGTARVLAAAGAELATSLGRVRVDAEAGRLADVRASHMVQAQQLTVARADVTAEQAQHLNERALDAIGQELVNAFEGAPARAANDQPGKHQLPAAVVPNAMQPQSAQSALDFRQENQTKAVQAIALIEQIEVFVKTAQRPALALTLNNSLGARVEIERVGPREVALKLVGQRGPPTPDAVSRIRDELRARGLKVAALSIA